MSEEWYYIKQWKEARARVWTLVDSRNNVYLPEGTFLTKMEVSKMEHEMRQENLNKDTVYRIVHRDNINFKATFNSNTLEENNGNNDTKR